MKFFNRQKKEKEEKKVAEQPAVGTVSTLPSHNVADVLHNPRITEKATDLAAGRNAYVFDVAPNANKAAIKKAVSRVYGVTPRTVKVVPVRAKMRRSVRTGKMGVTTGGKKAYVYLKEGDRITLT